MNYWTSYYWTNGTPDVSLTLQQVTRKRGKVPIVLACVCEDNAMTKEQGAGECFCVRLTDWLYERVLESYSRKKTPALTTLGQEVAQMTETASFAAAGILCIGERFLLFYRGEQRICLLNSRFLRPNIRELSANTAAEGKLVVKEGILQSRLGILLGSESFYRGISGEELRNCLAANAMQNEKQVNNRLLELGRYGESREVGSRAAVLLMTR